MNTEASTSTTVSPPLSSEQRAREEELVTRVVESFAGASDARLRQLMQSLTRHLHAFLCEVRLTESEWQKGIEFLTEAGHITTDQRRGVREGHRGNGFRSVLHPGRAADRDRRRYRRWRFRATVLGGGHHLRH